MYCYSLDECFEHISAYANGSNTGFPLLVDVENFTDYQGIVNRLRADDNKQCIYASEHIFGNGLPDIQSVISLLTQSGTFVVIGLSQAMMLHSQKVLDEGIDNLLGHSVRGHVIVLLNHCRQYIEKYKNRDPRIDNRIIILSGDTYPLPQIRLVASKEEALGLQYDDGIAALLSHLERITDSEVSKHPVITVVTPFSPTVFKHSLYAISSGGVYETIENTYPDIVAAVEENDGTEMQWTWLLKNMKTFNSFSDYITSRYGAVTGLYSHLGETYHSGEINDNWLLWLAMKVYGAGPNVYLQIALENSKDCQSLIEHIYQDLLGISVEDDQFERCFNERKKLISSLPENLPQVSLYCSNVGRHGRNAVYYLSDATENEEYTLMQLLARYDWDEETLYTAIQHGFPELALYMKDFVFDSINTKLSEKDASLRGVFTDYFHRYKVQKITNRIDPDFLKEVETFAVERPFYKLQPRSSIVTTMDKSKMQGYFFDALGVEFLAYIQAKCEQYGLIYEVHIGHCEIPSITVKNKDFKHYFDTRDIGDLDELKHHSQIYDYQKCEYPIHVFRELEIIDEELRRIHNQLILNDDERAVIFSDHGASRLAVIYEHENGSMLELDEKGKHSGRCCPVDKDPEIAQAAYEDGYAVLGNYERFKGGRKANLEVHGGASLEEVVVPVITLSLRPEEVVYYFVNPVVKYKMGKPCTIELFSNIPMSHPRIEVEGAIYEGVFSHDKNHAVFTLTKQKRAREYIATVYEGDANTGIEIPFRIERSTKARDLGL